MATTRMSGRDTHVKLSRAEAVARALEQEIDKQRLPVGHRLGTKDELRTLYSVAPATMNEALRILDIRGVVVARPGPGGGVFVATPSRQPFSGSLGLDIDLDAPLAEWREIRDSLEPLVVRKAARRCSSRDAVALRAIIADMASAVDDLTTFMSLHWKLHRHLADLGDNPPLIRLYHRLLDVMQEAIGQEIAKDPLYDPLVNLRIHEQLAEAVISGTWREVETAIRRHTPPPGSR